MYRILLLDADVVSSKAMQLVLQKAHYEVASCQTAISGLELLPVFKPDVVVIDLHQPGMAAINMLRSLQNYKAPPLCILINRFGHDDDRAEAIKVGAFDCVDHPLTPELLLAVVRKALAGQAPGTSSVTSDQSHALTRWADVVLRGVRSPHDMTTLNEWGRWVGVSKGGLRNWCYTARLSSRHSLQFMRLLRAVIRQQHAALAPEDLLDVVDRRTIAKLLRLAGGTTTALPKDVEQFLDKQQIIHNARAIAAVRAALSANGTALLPRSWTSRLEPDRDGLRDHSV